MLNMQPLPEDDAKLQSHPAVSEMRQIQAQWRKTGILDPRITAYQNAVSAAQKHGLDPQTAVLFAAKAATGK